MSGMPEELTQAPKPKLSLEESVKIGLSGSGIGDTRNNFTKCGLQLEELELWPKVRPAQTYNEYVRWKNQSWPELAEGIIAASDKSFVATYDNLAQRFNAAIGGGVTTQEQANTIGSIVREANALIDEHRRKLTN